LTNYLINDNAMMALKMLYRGPSSRLENLIEKIQATKEISSNGNYNKLLSLFNQLVMKIKS